MSLKIKVCGMREPENIRQLAALAPDYIGFIFYPPSQRYAGALDPKVLAALPATIRKTGVFVNAAHAEIVETLTRYRLDAVQLHGDESPELCAGLRASAEVIKAFGIDADFDFTQTAAFEGAVDYFLFDTKTPLKGGSGRRFDWKKLEEYAGQTPYFLSGGIGPEHIAGMAALQDPRLYAIDLNSRFEGAPGIKDIHKLSMAFHMLKSRTEPVK